VICDLSFYSRSIIVLKAMTFSDMADNNKDSNREAYSTVTEGLNMLMGVANFGINLGFGIAKESTKLGFMVH
jgi:hypothetical protein